MIHCAIPSGKCLTGNGFIWLHDSDPQITAKAGEAYVNRKTNNEVLSVMDWLLRAQTSTLFNINHLDREWNKSEPTSRGEL